MLTELLPDYRIWEGKAAIPQTNLKLPSVQQLLQSTRVRDPMSLLYFLDKNTTEMRKKLYDLETSSVLSQALRYNSFLSFTASMHETEQRNLERQRRCTCRNVIFASF